MTMLVRAASLVAALMATTTQSGDAQSPRPRAAGVASRSTDTVSVGCSGGTTGGGSGNTLTRGGQLAAYQQATFRRESITQTPLRRDSAAATRVFATLERVRFRALRFNKPDNMTCYLALQDRDGTHSVSWPMGQPPKELEPALAALKRAFGDDRRMWP